MEQKGRRKKVNDFSTNYESLTNIPISYEILIAYEYTNDADKNIRIFVRD